MSRLAYTACDEGGRKTASQGLTRSTASDYAGLQCVGWMQPAAGALSIDLINMPAACDYSSVKPDAWLASAELTVTGALRLSLTRDATEASSCTGCLHDFSLQFPTVTTEAELRLEIRMADCAGAGCPATDSALVLPAREDLAWSGMNCRYLALAGASSYRGVPTDGMANMPPVNNGCSTGLRVVPTPHGIQVCASSCNASTDCRPSDVLTCQDGHCLLSQTW